MENFASLQDLQTLRITQKNMNKYVDLKIRRVELMALFRETIIPKRRRKRENRNGYLLLCTLATLGLGLTGSDFEQESVYRKKNGLCERYRI
jgi:hypothetical protein